jgi:phage shock protein PspC (stress-responsive transcriptional regulator)
LLLRLVLFQVQLLLVRFLLVLVLLLVLQLVELLVYGMVCMNPMKHINAHIIHV